MKYSDFKDQIVRELLSSANGMTWREIREQLHLPYTRPCPTWVAQIEKETGLIRKKKKGRELIWEMSRK